MRQKAIDSMTQFRRIRIWQLTVLGVAALGVLASVALADGRGGQSSATSDNAEGPAAEAFAVLRRPRTVADYPSSYVAQFSGANMTLARRAQGFANDEAWVIPRDGSLCLVAESTTGRNGGAVCDADSAALSGDMAFYSRSPKAPDALFVAGLVPDGVAEVVLHVKSSSGSQLTETLRVHENVYMGEVYGSVSTIVENGPTPVTISVQSEPAN